MEVEMGIGGAERLERVRRIFRKLGVPTAIPAGLSKGALMDIIRRDKKAVGKWPRFVVIDKIGQVHCENGQYAVDVGREIVDKVLDKMLSRR